MKYQTLFVLVLLVAVSACGVQPSLPSLSRPSPTPDATVVAGTQKTEIPARFLGLNLEISAVCDMLTEDQTNPQKYEALFLHLGNLVLHIGGHTTDTSSWDPDGTTSCDSHH